MLANEEISNQQFETSQEQARTSAANLFREIELSPDLFKSKQDQSDNYEESEFMNEIIEQDSEEESADDNHNQIVEPRTGRFEPWEEKKLIKSISKYAVERDMDIVEFTETVIYGKKRRYGMWKQICSVLPARTVDSCYRYIKGAFNLNNRKGRWKEEQTKKLKELVTEHGHKWKLIAQLLGNRTAQNVKDKFKSMGESNCEQREVSFWKLSELVTLIDGIQHQVGMNLLGPFIKNDLERSQFHDEAQKKQCEQRKRISQYFVFHNTQVLLNHLNIERVLQCQHRQMNWRLIADKLGSKSRQDCRNKWTRLVDLILKRGTVYTYQQDLQLLQHLEGQDALTFKLQNNKSERQNKLRWLELRKEVRSGRARKDHKELINEIKLSLERKQNKNPQ